MEEKLREAACHGDIESIQSLIRLGVNINDQNKMNGWTALHWACKRNEKNAIKVRFLLSVLVLRICLAGHQSAPIINVCTVGELRKGFT